MHLTLVFLFLFLFSCTHAGKDNHANRHMHKSSHADLIERFEDPNRDRQQRPDVVMGLLAPLKGVRLIDIGVGSGYFTKHFLDAGAQVTGADVDDKFLQHSSKRFSGQAFSALKIAYDDPQMSEAQYDLAFMANTYHHIDDRVNYLKKVRAGLKPSGRFVVFDFKKNVKHTSGPPLSMRISLPEVLRELRAAGFQELTVHEQDFPDHYLVIALR
jgi:ubiquinone/menaquinone biosynthesis C-methylase UbiE